ncbi:MAG: hypothetical protein ACLR0U_11565 [Enterocloster clostridioformis]
MNQIEIWFGIINRRTSTHTV